MLEPEAGYQASLTDVQSREWIRSEIAHDFSTPIIDYFSIELMYRSGYLPAETKPTHLITLRKFMKTIHLIGQLLSMLLTVSAVSTSVQAQSVLFTDFARDHDGKIISMGWVAANDYCASGRVPGRLPTIRELAEHYNDGGVSDTKNHPVMSKPITEQDDGIKITFYYNVTYYKPIKDESVNHLVWSTSKDGGPILGRQHRHTLYLKNGGIYPMDTSTKEGQAAVRCVMQ